MKLLRFMIVFLLISCGSGSSVDSVSSEISAEIQEMIDKQEFKVKFLWAYPQQSSGLDQAMSNMGVYSGGSTAGQIDISSNSDFLTYKDGVATTDLSFYGERYSGVVLNDRGAGISFDSKPDKSHFKQKGNRTQWGFNIRDENNKMEKYKVYMEIFPNGKVEMVVNSNNRSTISYSGILQVVE